MPQTDPILSVIERHRELYARLDAATAVSAKLLEGPEFDAADEISRERRLALAEFSYVLIRSKPTTIAGAIDLSRYVGSLPSWQLSDDDENWHRVLLGTLADALDGIGPM